MARHAARCGHHRVDVAGEDEVRPVGEEGHVGLRVVEDGTARKPRVERKPELGAEEPVLGEQRVEVLLGEVEAERVFELVRAPVDRPHLEREAVVGLGPHEQVLREDAEVGGAALEARDQHQDRVGAAAALGELVAGVAGAVEREVRAELRDELRIGHADAGAPRRVPRMGLARDVDGDRRWAEALRAALPRTRGVGRAVALLARLDDAVAARGGEGRRRREMDGEHRRRDPSADHAGSLLGAEGTAAWGRSSNRIVLADRRGRVARYRWSSACAPCAKA